jgi:hypothetical protein
MPYAVKFYAYIFVANCFGLRHRGAMASPIRLYGEPGLWVGVRLSDDRLLVGGCLGERSCEADPAIAKKEAS